MLRGDVSQFKGMIQRHKSLMVESHLTKNQNPRVSQNQVFWKKLLSEWEKLLVGGILIRLASCPWLRKKVRIKFRHVSCTNQKRFWIEKYVPHPWKTYPSCQNHIFWVTGHIQGLSKKKTAKDMKSLAMDYPLLLYEQDIYYNIFRYKLYYISENILFKS